ncbi:hypothetical protein ACFXAW_30435 [Streptomyces sp. NPDC059445]|uniref:hypothetical protein n=1 Tax=Streptomyces sp. NPDC059445 TaxID=3346832 RepID=UPI0036B8FF5A
MIQTLPARQGGQQVDYKHADEVVQPCDLRATAVLKVDSAVGPDERGFGGRSGWRRRWLISRLPLHR